ncbi:hypothetical protein [Photobacterium damselae]|nr:hypothetical protein [Photobacterium damselae]NVO72692.1 hypothetical protein [Photobacterium damselae subsp. damselae]SPY24512.1 Uncharacterised protein [Photobacterium damselae]
MKVNSCFDLRVTSIWSKEGSVVCFSGGFIKGGFQKSTAKMYLVFM